MLLDIGTFRSSSIEDFRREEAARGCGGTRKPTQEEYDDSDINRHVHLTNEQVPWDPENADVGELEEAMLDTNDDLIIPDRKRDRTIMSLTQMERMHGHECAFQCDSDLGIALQSARHKVHIASINSGERKTFIRSNQLAQRWGISPKRAAKTLEATTQRMIRTQKGNKLVRRFKTNDRMLRYDRLSDNMYSDTMFSNKILNLKRPEKMKGERNVALPRPMHSFIPTTVIDRQNELCLSQPTK